MTIPSLGSKEKYTVTSWITSPLKVYDARDQVSSSNSPCDYKMVKETSKMWPRKESSVHMLCHFFAISGHCPRRDVGCLPALVGQYKPLTRFPFLVLPSAITRHLETSEQGLTLTFAIISVHLFSSTFTQTGMLQSQQSIRRNRYIESPRVARESWGWRSCHCRA